MTSVGLLTIGWRARGSGRGIGEVVTIAAIVAPQSRRRTLAPVTGLNLHLVR